MKNKFTQKELNEIFIGLDLRQAIEVACSTRLIQGYRITREDESYYVCTRDLKPNRVNLEFENGEVVKISLG